MPLSQNFVSFLFRKFTTFRLTRTKSNIERLVKTRQERLNSAPHSRLKKRKVSIYFGYNVKNTDKGQNFWTTISSLVKRNFTSAVRVWQQKIVQCEDYSVWDCHLKKTKLPLLKLGTFSSEKRWLKTHRLTLDFQDFSSDLCTVRKKAF